MGIEATAPQGENVLCIHHIFHPDKDSDKDDLICAGFTAHHEAMRGRFMDHMVEGVAIEDPSSTMRKISGQTTSTNVLTQEPGHWTQGDIGSGKVAAPCRKFNQI